MINLESRGLLAKWFVWSCDHLPLTTAHYIEGEGNGKRERSRSGAYYIERGTTLCHIFWAILWVPLIVVAVIGFIGFILCAVHVIEHDTFMSKNPDAGLILNVATYFLPEAFMACFALAAGCIILACIGGSKTGFFSLLWQYLKGIKQHICPLVRFGGTA